MNYDFFNIGRNQYIYLKNLNEDFLPINKTINVLPQYMKKSYLVRFFKGLIRKGLLILEDQSYFQDGIRDYLLEEMLRKNKKIRINPLAIDFLEILEVWFEEKSKRITSKKKRPSIRSRRSYEKINADFRIQFYRRKKDKGYTITIFYRNSSIQTIRFTPEKKREQIINLIKAKIQNGEFDNEI